MKPLGYTSADGKFSVLLSKGVLDRIVQICAGAGEYETGGILVGHYDNTQLVAIVTDITGPPKGSKHGRYSFERAVGNLQSWLDQLWQKQQTYYLGEWHFHPGAAPSPSSTDHQQMKAIATDTKYACPEPILLILGGRPPQTWALSVTVHLRSGCSLTLHESDLVKSAHSSKPHKK